MRFTTLAARCIAVAHALPELGSRGELSSAFDVYYASYVTASPSATGQGTILFGGVDRNKYTGVLSTLNLEGTPSSGLVDDFRVNVTAISVNHSGVTRDLARLPTTPGLFEPSPALLDTGTPATLLPLEIYSQIVTQFPYLDFTNTVRCSNIRQEDSIEPTFGNKAGIIVRTKEVTAPRIKSTTNAPIVDEQDKNVSAYAL